ncbi:MAG: S4 domain-containing protein [Solirubrobacterales bacterium]
MDSIRIDKWLVAVRVYKTRALAAEACGGGKVRVGGRAVKASYGVRVGERVSARDRDLEVVRLIEKRVGASAAAECFIDHTPVVERESRLDRAGAAFEREAGAGRPTKRDRRQLDRMRRGR